MILKTSLKKDLTKDKHSSLFYLQISLKLSLISLSIFSMEKPFRPSLVFTSKAKYHMIHKTILKKTLQGKG